MTDASEPRLDRLLAERDWLRRLAKRLVSDPADADDLTQETLVRAIERGGPSRMSESAGPLRGWLSTVMRRISIERYRADSRRRLREEAVAPFESGDRDALDRAALQRDIVDEVLRLAEPERSAVTLRYFEGLSYGEVGARQGINEAAARKRVSRGIVRLRERLDQKPGGRAGWLAIATPWVVVRDAAPLTSTGAASAAASAGGWIAMKTSTKALGAAALLLLGSAGMYAWLHSSRDGAEVDDVDRAALVQSPSVTDVDLAAVETEAEPERLDAAPAPAPEPAPIRSIAAFPKRPEDTTGSLELRVRWSDGEPAPGVTAKLMQWGDPTPRQRVRHVVTDDDGEVKVDDLVAGRVGIYLDRATGRSFEIEPGRVTVAEIEVAPGFEVVGRVLSPDGAGVAGATIVLSDYGNDGEAKPVGRSDANGEFRLRDVSSGRSLSARAAGYSPSSRVDLNQMKAGESYPVELTLLAGGGSLTGIVEDEDGTPIRGASLRVEFASSRFTGNNTHPVELESAEDGTFRLDDVGAGAGALLVRTESHVPRRIPFDVTAGEATNVTVVMVAGSKITGTITREDGSPATDANVWIGGRYAAYEYRGRSCQTDRTGSYTIHGVAPGKVEIQANERDHGKFAGTVVVARGGTATWNATLSAGRVVEGTITDEHGAPLVGWMVGTQSGRALWDRHTNSAADGAFRLMDVRPDAKVLHVTVPGGWQVGTVMTEPIGDGPVEIIVPDESRPTARVRLRVLADGRAPDPPAMIVVEVRGFGRREVYTDPSGEVEVGTLLAGPAHLQVRLDGYASAHREFELSPDELHDVGVVELVRGGRVQVRFTLSPDTTDGYLPTQATIHRPDGRTETFFDLEDGEGTSDLVEPGTYSVRAGTSCDTGGPMYVTVEDGATALVERSLRPGASVRIDVTYSDGRAAVGALCYHVTDAQGRVAVDRTRFNFSPMDGKTYVHVSGLPLGEFVAHFDDEEGASGEVAFSVTEVGDLSFGVDEPNWNLGVELSRDDD